MFDFALMVTLEKLARFHPIIAVTKSSQTQQFVHDMVLESIKLKTMALANAARDMLVSTVTQL